MSWNERRSWGPTLAVIAVMAAVLWMLTRQTGGADLSGWHTTMAAAQEASAASGRPILAYFSADWCGPCQTFKQQTLSRAQVMAAIHAGFEPAYLDVTGPDSAGTADGQRYGVRMIPTLMVVDAQGRQIARIAGVMNAQDFTAWMQPHADAR